MDTEIEARQKIRLNEFRKSRDKTKFEYSLKIASKSSGKTRAKRI